MPRVQLIACLNARKFTKFIRNVRKSAPTTSQRTTSGSVFWSSQNSTSKKKNAPDIALEDQGKFVDQYQELYTTLYN